MLRLVSFFLIGTNCHNHDLLRFGGIIIQTFTTMLIFLFVSIDFFVVKFAFSFCLIHFLTYIISPIDNVLLLLIRVSYIFIFVCFDVVFSQNFITFISLLLMFIFNLTNSSDKTDSVQFIFFSDTANSRTIYHQINIYSGFVFRFLFYSF